MSLAHAAVTVVCCALTMVVTAAAVSTYFSPDRIRRRREDAADRAFQAEVNARYAPVLELEAAPVLEVEPLSVEDQTVTLLGVKFWTIADQLRRAAYEPVPPRVVEPVAEEPSGYVGSHRRNGGEEFYTEPGGGKKSLTDELMGASA